MQLELFDFHKKLIDADGDTVIVDTARPKKEKTIQAMLGCSVREAKAVYNRLKLEYDVYTDYFQVLLTEKNSNKILYNFEKYGQTYYHGHKYNIVNEWDFKAFINGGKVKTEKKARRKKGLELTCTEMQLKKANQLWYAYSIGFDIGYADYKRFYLVE